MESCDVLVRAQIIGRLVLKKRDRSMRTRNRFGIPLLVLRFVVPVPSRSQIVVATNVRFSAQSASMALAILCAWTAFHRNVAHRASHISRKHALSSQTSACSRAQITIRRGRSFRIDHDEVQPNLSCENRRLHRRTRRLSTDNASRPGFPIHR